MEFKQITIPYEGREEFPSNSGQSVKSIISKYMTGGGGTSGGADNRGGNASAFFGFLSKNSESYSMVSIAESGVSDYIQIYGYKNSEQAQTLVGDITQSAASPDYNILGIPESGMTVAVLNNGTSGASILLSINSDISEDYGTLVIPVAININDNNLDPYHAVWNENQSRCVQMNLQFAWTINKASTGAYVLDLSNQTAQVNCDSAGTLYPNSIATLQCTATTYFNGAVASGITYAVRTQAAYAATGFSINQNTGALSFNSAGTKFYWATAYPALPIDIIAYKEGDAIATKTMTISRNYPGTDGKPAHTWYIVTDADSIVFDPNTSAFTPSQVTGRVMLQVGDQLPVYDSARTLYQWYDDLEEYKTSGMGTIIAQTYLGISSISFGLLNSQGEYFEQEDVPVIPAGMNGTPGASGQPGTSGESAWYMTLSNDNASINADADGNILSGAVRPTCQAKLYHGNGRITNATYVVDYGDASGITYSTTNGILTLSFGSGFDFTGGTLAISISGYSGSMFRDAKTMNITKSIAGASGQDAVSYWLEVSYGEVIYDPNTKTPNPSAITCEKYKQVGQQAAVPASDATIKYRWQSRSTGAWTNETAYTSAIQVSSGNCNTYSRLRFTLYVGQTQVDQEDVDILKNGIDGSSGQARAGAAIRGPYDYYALSGSNQCWYGGNEGDGAQCGEEGEKWIDVILKDGVYYYCNHTYYGKISDGMSHSPSYWTPGENFDFIATNVLLASAASINFLTNNELYLRDSNNQITAGAAGGDGINFWAGSDSPGDAPFTVSNDGTMVATQGTFGPFTIGTDTAGESALAGEDSSESYGTTEDYKTYINPRNIYFKGSTTTDETYYEELVSIAPNRDIDKYDGDGTIQVTFTDQQYDSTCDDTTEIAYPERRAFFTNGNMVAHRYLGQTRSHQINSYGGQAVMSPILGVEVTFMTSASTNFAKYGTWFIDGVDTTISAAEPRSLFTYRNYTWYFDGVPLSQYGYCNPDESSSSTFSTGGTQTWHFNGVSLGYPTANYSYVGTRLSSSSFGTASDTGYWMVYNSGGGALNTGIANPNYITKRNNVIYIEI